MAKIKETISRVWEAERQWKMTVPDIGMALQAM